MRKVTPFAAALTLVLLTSCVDKAAVDANPHPPVPPLISEAMPLPPVTAEALMWQPGHWDWDGATYVWAKGQYVPAAGHGNLWMPGWWSRTPEGWTWQPAHWMS